MSRTPLSGILKIEMQFQQAARFVEALFGNTVVRSYLEKYPDVQVIVFKQKLHPSVSSPHATIQPSMLPASQPVGIAALALVALGFAVPIIIQPDTVDCEAVTTGLSPPCWGELDMDAWMRNWTVSASPNATDGAAAAAAARCREDEVWSTCFLRLGQGVTGRDCSMIDTGGENSTCPMPELGVGPPYSPQMFYGVWNLYGNLSFNRDDESQQTIYGSSSF